MQTIVFTRHTGELVLHSGPYILATNYIVKLEEITQVTYTSNFFEARNGDEVKLRVPINKTNVIYI